MAKRYGYVIQSNGIDNDGLYWEYGGQDKDGERFFYGTSKLRKAFVFTSKEQAQAEALSLASTGYGCNVVKVTLTANGNPKPINGRPVSCLVN